jgi:hypothetical protein
MEYVSGRMDGRPTGVGTGTFTGRALLDPVIVWAEEVTEEHYTTVTGD